LTRAEQEFVKTYQMFRQQKLAEGAADHVRMVMSRAADIMKQRGFRAVGQLSDRDLEQIAQETDATPHDVAIILNIDHAHEQAVAEFAPGAQRDDRGPDEEEILRQYAAQWYNGDEDPRVEKLLATMGWEIGQNEDEAGGAFVIRSGDINGDSFISWTDAELSALNEISDELRRSYLGRAGQQVDRRQTRMAQVRDRLNKGYEIYHAEDPTFIVHRFEADTPQEARRYYERYDADYDSDVDYDLQLRRATGLMEEGVSENKQITWTKPNFDREYDEVEWQLKHGRDRIPQDVLDFYAKYFPTKQAWLKAVRNGRAVEIPVQFGREIRNNTENKKEWLHALSAQSHDPEGPAKKARVDKLFAQGGPIEMPIILNTGQGLWLIGGKTRLGKARLELGIPATVWIIGGKQAVNEDED
jgi:hypothetical protein